MTGLTTDRLHPHGSLAEGPWDVVVRPEPPAWSHAGLRVARLDGALELPAADLERLIVPLAGGCTVTTADGEHRLEGRRSPFDGPTDVLYIGSGTACTIRGGDDGRVAVAEARSTRRLPVARVPREAVPVELRGAGSASRQVHDLGVPGVLDAEALIVCEVVTPAGNWSSYPPHRHDRVSETETALEEVYYFEAAPERGSGGVAEDAFGLFTAYASDDRPIDLAGRVATGDVALVPHGYHGPAAAAPGYDLYYLNVMAGPGPERAWRITDDPAHAHVRDGWASLAVDPRLPIGTREGRA